MVNLDKTKPVSRATLQRLPRYYHYLGLLMNQGREVVSCTKLASHFGFDPTQIRKDIESAGGTGRPRVGFDIPKTMDVIKEFLGWNNTNQAVLVGAGHLGSALLGYDGFAGKEIKILAAFDSDPDKTGTTIHNTQVFPMEKLPELIRRLQVYIGILSVPADVAQPIAETMIAAGVRAIWNLTPAHLRLPDNIIVSHFDISANLAVLCSQLAEVFRNEQKENGNGKHLTTTN